MVACNLSISVSSLPFLPQGLLAVLAQAAANFSSRYRGTRRIDDATAMAASGRCRQCRSPPPRWLGGAASGAGLRWSTNRVRGQAPQFGALRWRRTAPESTPPAVMAPARPWRQRRSGRRRGRGGAACAVSPRVRESASLAKRRGSARCASGGTWRDRRCSQRWPRRGIGAGAVPAAAVAGGAARGQRRLDNYGSPKGTVGSAGRPISGTGVSLPIRLEFVKCKFPISPLQCRHELTL